MIKELIYSYYRDKELSHANENKDNTEITFAPSYVCKCKREIYYKKTNTEQSNPNSEASLIKMDMGNAVHDNIQKMLEEMGIYEEGEDLKEITWNGLKWKYRVDGVLNVNKQKYLLEIKTIYNTGFRVIEKQAKQEHELQLLLYLLFESIERGNLLYIGRDNGHMVEYNYRLESLKDKYFDFMANKVAELYQLKASIEKKILPARDYNIVLKNLFGEIKEKFTKDKIEYKTDWQCSYCNYKNLCWKKEYDEIKNNRFYINGKFIN